MKKLILSTLCSICLSFLFAQPKVPYGYSPYPPTISALNNCGFATISYNPNYLPSNIGYNPDLKPSVWYAVRYYLQKNSEPTDSLNYFDSQHSSFNVPPGQYRIVVKYVYENDFNNSTAFTFTIPNANLIAQPTNIENLTDVYGIFKGYTAVPSAGSTLNWYSNEFGNDLLFNGSIFKPAKYYPFIYVASINGSGCESKRVKVFTENMIKVSNTLLRKSGVKNQNDISQLAWNESLKQKQYFDGGGKLIQQIDVGISPNYHNVVKPIVYDNNNNSPKQYLPYSSSGDFKYRTNSLVDQANFYSNPTIGIPTTNFPFSETIYDDSPLNRRLEQTEPGDIWKKGGGRTKNVKYLLNIANEVRWFKESTTTPNTYNGTEIYPINKLLKTETVDENGSKKRSFVDLQGRKICDMQEFETNVWLSTYYIYNNMNQLKYILQPAGFKLMSSLVPANYTLTTSIINDFTFQYTYDERGRIVIKKVPGGGFDSFVYDKADRLRLSQNGTQNSESKWVYYKYDVQNRIIISGIYPYAGPRSNLQTLVNNSTSFSEQYQSVNVGYTNLSFPTSGTTELNVNYYDNYNYFLSAGVPTFTPRSNHKASDRVFGKLTRSMTRLLKANGTYSSGWYSTYLWYDQDGKTIQSHKQYPNSRTMLTQINFSFTGQPVTSVKTLKANGNIIVTTKDSIAYDHADRVLDIYFKVNNDNEMHMVFNKYNELGQLIQKSLHYDWMWSEEAYLQTIDYRYNERGWLKKINNSTLTVDPDNESIRDAFGEELFYDNAVFATTGTGTNFTATKQYNGNIAQIQWATKSPNVDGLTSPKHTYVYKYDKANRLTQALYALESLPGTLDQSKKNAQNESIGYDENGNTKSTLRNNYQGVMDNVSTIYQGNRLITANDAIPFGGFFKNDFEDNGSTTGIEYLYDNGGNLKEDKNKQLKFFYNVLGLPRLVHKTTATQYDTVKYVYDANGTKLQKITSNSIVRDYVEGFEFVNNVFQFGTTAEGRFRPKNGGATNPQQMVYDYDLKDHLGSTRVVITNEHIVSEEAATMENQNGTVEEQAFLNVAITRAEKDPNAPEDTTYSPDEKVSELNAVTGNNIGFAKTLELKAGDEINFSVKYFQEAEPIYNNTSTVISGILNQLKNIFFTNTATFSTLNSEEQQILEETGNNTFGDNSLVNNFLTSLLKDPAKEGYTKAQLIYLYLDRDFNLVETMSGSVLAEEEGVIGSLAMEGLKVEQDGFMHIFVANETPTPVEFDNLIVGYKTGAVNQVNNYYPFGLLWDGISLGDKTNEYLFGGKELQNELSLSMYDFEARMQDPQLGRFWSADPLADDRFWVSPYNYVQNNPVGRVDPTGMLDAQYGSYADQYQDLKDDASFADVTKLFYVESYVWKSDNQQHNYFSNNDIRNEIEKEDNDPFAGATSLGIRYQTSLKDLKALAEGSGGGGLNTANNWLGYAGYGEAVFSGIQMGMIEYRQSLSINNKIGTFSSFSTTYKTVGTTGKILGGAYNYVGAPLNTLIDYNSMKKGEIGVGRFSFRTAGTAVGIGVGSYFGALPGALIGGGFWAGEKSYDGYMYWQTQMGIFINNVENGFKSGWLPGR